jgi:hypothetical protein
LVKFMSKLIKRKQLDLKLKALLDQDNIAGVTGGEQMETAFEKILAVLDKMAPAMPPLLNSLSLAKTLSGTTMASGARLTTDGSAVAGVHKFSNGATITWTTTGVANGVTTRDGHFRDGDSATAKLRISHIYNNTTKTAIIDGINAIAVDGTKMAEDTTGFNVRVTITEKKDYYSSDASATTKSNFYNSIKGAIAATMATGVNEADALERTVKIEYSESGDFTDTIQITGAYRIEAAAAPTATAALTIPVMGAKVSGVPSLATGDTITVSGAITNGIKFYYPATIGTSTVTAAGSGNNTLSGTKPANSVHSYSASHIVVGNSYSESIAASVTPYDIFAAGATASATTDNSKRVDTKSLAKVTSDASKRLLSPASNNKFDVVSASFYDVAAHANSLDTNTGVYGNALQLLNGIYQYPAAVNYTSQYGEGGNFTNLTNFPANQFRYADFVVGSVSAANFLLLTVAGIGSAVNASDLVILVRVDGASPTGGDGWIDANLAYGGSGNPTGVDGSRGAYDTNSSLSKDGVRRITFGTDVKTGSVKVRVGIRKGSSLSFTSISIS